MSWIWIGNLVQEIKARPETVASFFWLLFDGCILDHETGCNTLPKCNPLVCTSYSWPREGFVDVDLSPFRAHQLWIWTNFIDIYRHIVWKIVERGGKSSNLHNSHTSWQLMSAWSEATAGSPCPSWSEWRMWLRIWCLGEPWLVANSAFVCIYKNIKKTRIEYCSTTCYTVLLCSI